MAQVKGLDNGYLYTKDNDQRIFRSAYSKSNVATGCTSFITIDGVDYSVGTGDRSIQIDKTDSEINKVCTLTNLALTGSDEYYLVVGLPIGQYKTQKDKFKKMIMGYNDCDVTFKGKKFEFAIKDVLVMPQGIGALLSLEEIKSDIIIFDFGGLTIDIASVEVVYGNPILKKYDTWTEGIQKVYSRVITDVNEKYNLTLDVSYAEKILVDGLTIHGERKDTDFLNNTLRQYIDPIMTNFKVNFPDVNSQIYLSCGSAIIFYDLFREYFPAARLIPSSQFANAIGYYKVGLQKFGKVIYQKQQVISSCSYCGKR
jgi:plasmid segregation protein ParM